MSAVPRNLHTSIYPGLEVDPLVADGHRRGLGNAILLARVLGMVRPEETCAGWSASALDHLCEAVWYRYDRAPGVMQEAIYQQLRKARFQFLKKRRLGLTA
ncbi:MAG: hypothetical protein ACFCVA_11380 [Gammaproteobacteria bacterium]